MFDPEDLAKAKIEVPNLKVVRQTKTEVQKAFGYPEQGPTPPTVLSEKERLRYYLINDSGTRKYYGFEMLKDGEKYRLHIADISKLERLDSTTKAMLRELYLELK